MVEMSQRYFDQLSEALNREGVAYPVLVIDKARFDHNLACLKKVLDKGFDYRIVAKSLPCISLLQYLMAETNTRRLMCFHLPFLMHVIESLPEADILLGKPMTINGLKCFYHWHRANASRLTFNPDKQLQWLVDSESRLAAYESVALSLGLTLNINLEVDIGLHRGGYSCEKTFCQSLRTIKASSCLKLSGIMGYEAHITKIPAVLGGPKKAAFLAKMQYQKFVGLIEQEVGDVSDLCLNTGGSSTYPLYGDNESCNEIATASALVKPSDFDVDTLAHHQPATFIATPVLKCISQPELPMAKKVSFAMRGVGLMPRQACFIYGGGWLASPCFPEGVKKVDVYGHSTNQELYSLPAGSQLQEEDFMFFRPTQSEAVFLQFGKIAIYENGQIIDWWSVFSYPDLNFSKIQ